VDDVNAWRWPEHPGDAVTFTTTLARAGVDRGRIALIICLSGTIRLEELPREIDESHFVYVLAPTAPSRSAPALVAQPATLANFEATLREFLAAVEADHGKVATIALFPAIPISAAITVGRVLMLNVSPAWLVFDRDGSNRFFEALEVRR
jgi:hypothetical protein